MRTAFDANAGVAEHSAAIAATDMTAVKLLPEVEGFRLPKTPFTNTS